MSVRQFIKKIKSIMPIDHYQEDIITRIMYCESSEFPERNRRIIIQFPFMFVWKHLLNKKLLNNLITLEFDSYYRWRYVVYTDYIHYICDYIGCILLNMYKLRKLKSAIVYWYRNKVIKTATIIARNKKDNKPDIECILKYNPRVDTFWNTALFSKMKGGMDGDKYIVYTTKENTTQEAVQIFCLYKDNKVQGKVAINNYLSSVDSCDELKMKIGHLNILGDIWDCESFKDDSDYNYLMNYINSTLYKMNGTTSYERLNLFINTNKILAEYIWDNNFSTPEQRSILGTAMGISSKNLGGFKRATTLDALTDYLNTKMSRGKTIYDNLPQHLWNKIQKAEQDLITAKQGVRVGLFGHYISSEDIDAAQNRLSNAWKDADRWLGQNLKKK